ncbi:GNAT family N-acetyltransferase [Bacillus infantis]|uniref:GNAT family N-acetyltransferase n=1 Tax=Bacillus infantis TaxID=324767 RepID=A0A5D4SS10_9BACI|nr:GNAT family N-acetyltransferase [Bacillus infantis]TYS65018.1 GNAT family N-acetyltransferase [Bacillus infantis]
MEIREARYEDIPELTELAEQLGYPVSIERMADRFKKIQTLADHYTLAAVSEDRLMGMIGFHTGYLYTQDSLYARVTALVIHKDFRGSGIGKMLLAKMEEMAVKLGAVGIVLNSGNREEREIAHQFYSSAGYAAKSTGYVKSL